MSDKIIKQIDLQECRKNCDIKEKTMSEKIDDLKENISGLDKKIDVLAVSIPADIEKRFQSHTKELSTEIRKESDEKYALKSVEKDLASLKARSGAMVWDVMKIIVQALIALGVAYVALMK